MFLQISQYSQKNTCAGISFLIKVQACRPVGWWKCLLLPKIFPTYPARMEPGTVIPQLKKIQKVYESCDTLLEFCCHQYFFTKNHQILLYQEIRKQTAFWYIISNSVFEFLKIFLKNMVTILMMLGKLAALGRNKDYDVIIYVLDVTNTFLSSEWHYIVDVVMWPKDLTRKIAFFEGSSWFNFNNLGLAPEIALKFYTSARGKRVKTKSQEALEVNSSVCRSYRGKTSRFLCPHPE